MTTTVIVTVRPSVALNILINMERRAVVSTMAESCAWCGEASDGIHYPAPFPDRAEDELKNFFTACGQEHADLYRAHYMGFARAVLGLNAENAEETRP